MKNFKTPCLVVHSQNDFRVPLDQGLQLFTSLQRMNVPSKFLYFPDEDHFVTKPQNAEMWSRDEPSARHSPVACIHGRVRRKWTPGQSPGPPPPWKTVLDWLAAYLKT